MVYCKDLCGLLYGSVWFIVRICVVYYKDLFIIGIEEDCLMHFKLSPDGKYIAFMGKYGRIHFIASKVRSCKENQMTKQ